MEEVWLFHVDSLMFTNRWKEEILTYMKLLMEQKKLGVLSDDSTLIAQMNEQQFEYLQPKTAREHIHMKFWHPLRRHDDQLFALALACYASKEEEPFIAVLSTN
jgi:phage FluMu gp28-like protein